MLLTNTRSLVNKFDEMEIVLQQEIIDVAVITESWFHPLLPEHMLAIDGYNLFSKCRTHVKGGGVAVYVRSHIMAKEIDVITVPEELECKWVLISPKRTPRDVSLIAVCAVYITTDSPNQETLRQHILESMDILHVKYPDIGFLILGDFNRMNTSTIQYGYNLKQVVDFPTRDEATLDLILTNMTQFY